MLLPLLNSNGEHRMLDVREIVYLQTNGAGELTIYSYDDEYKIISMVKDLSILLQDSGFIRTDRGTVVNMESIESFDGILNIVKLRTSNGEVIAPVSHKMQKQIKAYLKGVRGASRE
ncbi:LytTR family DNA-binding domain-containing protein [Cohnella cholangitidis]|uniref:LytTR family transcriptional regulator n=1 Tax=Cohnella cholangitidis TaxID=2598458 RepID=A0A7G5C0K9_9BACL|nr:LytTR family DNA-binding domain-containing protein [Cohnella cholangitidis]QMV42743.1 LytTR family transcriptional regulator [Cohnella cholangitidis]